MTVVVAKIPPESLCRLCPEDDEETVREVGAGEMVSSAFTCAGLRNEVNDWWVC